MDKPIITPYSLSQFRINYASKEKSFLKLREDPVKSYKPKEPLFDPSKDGRMAGINTVTQYILRSIHASARPEDDPREALISYSVEADKNPEWVSPAYSKTQPKPIFDYKIMKEGIIWIKTQRLSAKVVGLSFALVIKEGLGMIPSLVLKNNFC